MRAAAAWCWAEEGKAGPTKGEKKLIEGEVYWGVLLSRVAECGLVEEMLGEKHQRTVQ